MDHIYQWIILNEQRTTITLVAGAIPFYVEQTNIHAEFRTCGH